MKQKEKKRKEEKEMKKKEEKRKEASHKIPTPKGNMLMEKDHRETRKRSRLREHRMNDDSKL